MYQYQHLRTISKTLETLPNHILKSMKGYCQNDSQSILLLSYGYLPVPRSGY